MSLGMVGDGTAREKQLVNTCTCACDAGGAGFYPDMIFDSVATSCLAYEGKTCNFERPNRTIATGKLVACAAGTRWKIQGTLKQKEPGKKPVTNATGATGKTTPN